MINTSQYSGNRGKIIRILIDRLGVAGYNRLAKLDIIVKDGAWTLNVFGWHYPADRRIEAYAPAWIPHCLRDRANALIIIHEYYNLLGLKCACPWCLVYENDARYLLEVLAMPLQALRDFRLCNKCKKRLEAKNED